MRAPPTTPWRNPFKNYVKSDKISFQRIFMDVLTTYILDNVSVKQIKHILQQIESGHFQMYDDGPEMNSKRYDGKKTPPKYNLSAVEFPVMIMYGSSDGLAVPVVRILIIILY